MQPAHSIVGDSWLALLVDGCSLAELETFRTTKLHAASGDEVATAMVESEARRALHLHALLNERQSRAAELAVLNDLSRQLSAMRRPHQVLTEVAAQTRRLLAVDLAYIMLADDERVLTMEVVEGSLGSALRGARIVPGTGIGGVVMESGQPHWTEDFQRDDSLTRPDVLHDAVSREGMRAILGVPLRVGSATIGVLFAADRAPRRFSEHEIGLLTAFAAHGAVAIHNANLFDENRRATVELTHSNEQIRRTVELHERLTDVVLRGGGLEEVVAALAGLLGAAVAVLGPDDTPLAEGGPGDLGPQALGCFSEEFARPDQRRTCREGVGTSVRLVVPIVLVDGYAGCVVAVRELGFDDITTLSVERGVTVIGLVLVAQRAVAEAERRAHGEFIAALLGGLVDDTSVQRRARAVGIDLRSIKGLIVLGAEGETAKVTRAVSTLARAGNGWAAEYAGRWVVLVPEPELEALRRAVREHVPAGAMATSGVASAKGSIASIQQAYRSANDCVSLLYALGRAGQCATVDEMGIYRALFSTSGKNDLERFVSASIGRLLAVDRDRSTHLVETLDSYLTHSCKHAAAASALQLHPNTLYQRLARITEILGEDWRNPERRLELQLALRLQRLAAALTD